MNRSRHFLLALSLLLAGSVTAAAQTLSFADAIERLAAACRADIERHCKGVELGGGRVPRRKSSRDLRAMPANPRLRLRFDCAKSRSSAQHCSNLQFGHCDLLPRRRSRRCKHFELHDGCRAVGHRPSLQSNAD